MRINQLNSKQKISKSKTGSLKRLLELGKPLPRITRNKRRPTLLIPEMNTLAPKPSFLILISNKGRRVPLRN